MEGQEQIILVFEVMIDDPRAVFDLGGDLSDTGVFVPFGEENFPCCVENQVFNFFTLPFFSLSQKS